MTGIKKIDFLKNLFKRDDQVLKDILYLKKVFNTVESEWKLYLEFENGRGN